MLLDDVSRQDDLSELRKLTETTPRTQSDLLREALTLVFERYRAVSTTLFRTDDRIRQNADPRDLHLDGIAISQRPDASGRAGENHVAGQECPHA